MLLFKIINLLRNDKSESSQTNRHGLPKKGCNQASADSKHYLVSMLCPPIGLNGRKRVSVEGKRMSGISESLAKTLEMILETATL